MNETKATPGPWVVCPNEIPELPEDHESVVVWAANRKLDAVAQVFGELTGPDYERPLAEQMANARLIAAAPEMLAALEAAESILRAYIPGDQWDGHCAAAYVAVSAAISKAKGAHP